MFSAMARSRGSVMGDDMMANFLREGYLLLAVRPGPSHRLVGFEVGNLRSVVSPADQRCSWPWSTRN